MSENNTFPAAPMRLALSRPLPDYDAAAVLQREVAGRMAERLAYIKHAPDVIVDVGARTGFGTQLLRAHFPSARILAVDVNAQLLRPLTKTSGGWKRLLGLQPSPAIQTACADLVHLPLPPASADMIWSNLALHAYNPEHAIEEAHRVLKHGGLLMLSLFGPDTLKELRQCFAADGAAMPRFTDMHDIGDILSHYHFTTPVMDMETITLTYDDIAGLLRDIRNTGEDYLLPPLFQNLADNAGGKSVASAYEKFRQDGKLPATFEIVYGHAWKAEADKRMTDDGRQIIEFKQYKKAI
jgi:malonyl-CoA O-methyltransferase